MRLHTPPRLCFEQCGDDHLRITRYARRVLDIAALDLCVKFLLGLAAEWEASGQHGVEEDSERPHVDLAAVVLGAPDELRSHVAGRAAENFLLLPVLAECREPEVDDFDHVSLFLDQHIIQFEVAVCDASAVEVLESSSLNRNPLLDHRVVAQVTLDREELGHSRINSKASITSNSDYDTAASGRASGGTGHIFLTPAIKNSQSLAS